MASTRGADVAKILRDGYEPPRPEGWPTAREWNSMSFEERAQLPENREPIPMWAVDPEFRRREGRAIARRIEMEEGPEAAAKALSALERAIEEDERRWQEYRTGRRATA